MSKRHHSRKVEVSMIFMFPLDLKVPILVITLLNDSLVEHESFPLFFSVN